jgi:SHS2 domain-containing protein
MKSHGFKEVVHTADLAIKVWAEDFESLLRQSARGMYALMAITVDPSHHVTSTFMITDGSKETILVDFLNELLFLVEEKMEKYDAFSFTREDKGLEITAQGSPIESIQREIKAVTFHNLDIRETDSGMTTKITFDV